MGYLKDLKKCIRQRTSWCDEIDVLAPAEGGLCPLEWLMLFFPSDVSVGDLLWLFEQESEYLHNIKEMMKNLVEKWFKEMNLNVTPKATMDHLKKVADYKDFAKEVVEILRFARGFNKVLGSLANEGQGQRSKILEEITLDAKYFYEQPTIRKNIMDGTIKSCREMLQLKPQKHTRSFRV
jgi:hypothetical protein